MKSLLFGNVWRTLVILLMLAGLGFGGYSVFFWHIAVETGAAQGNAAFAYLSQEVGKDAKGNPITRAAVLDAAVKQALEAAKQESAPAVTK